MLIRLLAVSAWLFLTQHFAGNIFRKGTAVAKEADTWPRAGLRVQESPWHQRLGPGGWWGERKPRGDEQPGPLGAPSGASLAMVPSSLL